MSNYTIIIDYREKRLIEVLKDKLIFKTENLAIGDIILKKEDKIEYCIERKTIDDLASSIKDGRYKEQQTRILETVSPNQCCYLIEGKIPNQERYSNMPISTLYGSIINKMFRDGIFIYHTINLEDTSRFIQELGKRFLSGKLEFKELDKGNQYFLDKKNYVQTPRKKGNISVSDCFSNQLATIPSISSVKILALKLKFNSMKEFILYLDKQENPEKYLEEIILNNNRKLGKSSSQKILDFLGFTKNK